MELNEQVRRQRKILLFLPVVMIPLFCAAFWGLGGGHGKAGKDTGKSDGGINMVVPGPRAEKKGRPAGKLEYYKQAEQDSIRLAEARQQEDPYYLNRPESGTGPAGSDTAFHRAGMTGNGRGLEGLGPVSATNEQADELLRKLDRLKDAVKSQTEGAVGAGMRPADRYDRRPSFLGGELGNGVRLPFGEARAATGNTDLDRLGSMLDKILQIQHPDMMPSRDSGVVPVAALPARVEAVRPEAPVQTLDPEESGTGFIEIGERDSGDTLRQEVFRAVINNRQTLAAGSTVELRLMQEVRIGGRVIPKDLLLYGTASLSGERLGIHISSIGEGILPVDLQVYDLDGQPGIRVQGTMVRDVSKESAGEALSGLGIASLDPSLGAQAASAGLQFAKSLAGRKLRTVWVTLPAGYQVWLKNKRVH